MKKTHSLRIIQDHDSESPRSWDNLGTMYCEHGRYTLGDEDAEDIRDENGKIPAEYIVLPLYLYDHSGITMSTGPFSCPWDSGQVGYIYVSKEQVRKEYGWKVITKKRRELIETYLTGEVETYDQYLTGDVWGFILEKYIKSATDEPDESGDGIEDQDEPETEEVDSCWGFYGDDPETNGMKDHISVDLDACDIQDNEY